MRSAYESTIMFNTFFGETFSVKTTLRYSGIARALEREVPELLRFCLTKYYLFVQAQAAFKYSQSSGSADSREEALDMVKISETVEALLRLVQSNEILLSKFKHPAVDMVTSAITKGKRQESDFLSRIHRALISSPTRPVCMTPFCACSPMVSVLNHSVSLK